jgi:hypothetical protein
LPNPPLNCRGGADPNARSKRARNCASDAQSCGMLSVTDLNSLGVWRTEKFR